MKFLDLFSGIGGFRSGLEKVGFNCVGFVEKDKFAVKSYRELYNTKGEFYGENITTIKGKDLPEADIWTAGFPCQDISIAGRKKGFAGERSSLFFEVIRLLGERERERERDLQKPRFLLFENVKNLLFINGGRDFASFLRTLSECGYNAEWQVLNTSDFGLPQSRKRVFVIGHLRNRSSKQIFPVKGVSKGYLKPIISGRQAERVFDPTGVSTTLIANGGGGGAKTGLYFIDLCTTESKITETARCLQTRYHKGCSKHKGECSGVLQNTRVRRLTPLECWRLQGFTDEQFFKAQAVNSDTQLYKQAGNSISVPVVEAIAKRIMKEE